MGAIVIRTRFDEGTESAEVATSGKSSTIKKISLFRTVKQHDVELPQNIVFNNFEEKKDISVCSKRLETRFNKYSLIENK
jgi:hypothetical protein